MKTPNYTHLLIFLLSLWPAFECFAQEKGGVGKLEFASRAEDLGRIPADGGCVFSHRFEFTNEGNAPFEVQQVNATCGCTVTEFSKGSIAPKEKGYVMASFDPKGYDGPFNKSISVSSDGIELGVEVLFLSGFVVADSSCANGQEGKKETIAKVVEVKEDKKPKKEELVPLDIPQPFRHTFSYGKSQIDPKDPRLLNWLEKVEKLVERNNEVEIQIESSASKVPSGSSVSNEELAASRARNTRALMSQLLLKRGIKESQLRFVDDEVLVQGEDYAGDAKANPKKYERWQYVIVKVN